MVTLETLEFTNGDVSLRNGLKELLWNNGYRNKILSYDITAADVDGLEAGVGDRASVIINRQKVNNHRYLNRFFHAVNAKLEMGGLYICCVETKSLRKERIMKKYPVGIRQVVYGLDFMLHRVMPKLPLVKQAYFNITNGTNRTVSFAELAGRLASSGFAIREYIVSDGLAWFLAEKTGLPITGDNPSYGFLIRLNRIGHNGKMVKVYKFRTMHPYSEYIQDFVYENNSLKEGGKFSNDFRITTWGKFMRRLWLDELPMLYNLFKGDVKLVGVRPLSKQYFSMYPEHIKTLRTSFKPGLIPPFYYDMPVTFKEIIQSEEKYLAAYGKNPLRTDLRYFWGSFVNILFRKARSN